MNKHLIKDEKYSINFCNALYFEKTLQIINRLPSPVPDEIIGCSQQVVLHIKASQIIDRL